MEFALVSAEISWKYRENQKEIGDEKRPKDERQRSVSQVPFVRAENRHHKQRQEQKRDVGLEVARSDRVGVDCGKIPEIPDFPLNAVVVQGPCVLVQGSCATSNRREIGFGLRHSVRL